tara:strand:- start:230 stop:772 length:543 start_codon:yes stop_codon:yes gene_type:complete
MANPVVGAAKVAANLTGKQINTLLSKLGMDKNILKGMNENQKKLAIADLGKKHVKNIRNNTNTRVGTTALVLATPAAYGIADMVHDFLGISKLADGTILKDPKANRAKSQGGRTAAQAKASSKKVKAKSIPLPKPKPKMYNMQNKGKGTAEQRLTEIDKNKVLAKVKKAAKRSSTKKGNK